MRILKFVGLGLLIIIGLIVLIGLFLPSKQHLERTRLIKASDTLIYDQINILKNWEPWNPWIKMDPQAQMVYSGPASGPGATYKWKGDKVGEGSMEITSAIPYSFVATRMFYGGSDVPAIATFKLDKKEGGTQVTWTMDGEYGWNIMGRWFGLFMETLVGKEYENGLQNIADITEKLEAAGMGAVHDNAAKETTTPAAPLPGEAVVIVDFPANEQTIDGYAVKTVPLAPMKFISSPFKSTMQEIGAGLGMHFGILSKEINRQKAEVTGYPFAIYHSFSKDYISCEAALPVKEIERNQKNYDFHELSGGKAVRVEYKGRYEGLRKVYPAIDQYIAKNNLKKTGEAMEIYVTDPMQEKDPSKWITYVQYAVEGGKEIPRRK